MREIYISNDDVKRMAALGAGVYAALLQQHDQLPFPLRDRFERWILDRERRKTGSQHVDLVPGAG